MTRGRGGATELLVHVHQDVPEAGLQVLAGTIDPGEEPAVAAVREVFEEAGLAGARMCGLVARYVYEAAWDGSRHDRHVYHLELAAAAPEAWEHVVSAGDADQGLIFCYSWRRLADGIPLAGGQGTCWTPCGKGSACTHKMSGTRLASV